jgi:hypothetical protein
MRKLLLSLSLLVALGVTGVAWAANQYTVSGKVTPTGATKKKPKPVSIQFSFTNSDPAGTQPSPIRSYSIRLEGTRVNTGILPVCTASRMTSAQSDAGCSRKAMIGSGTIDSLVGTTGTPTSSSVACRLALRLYNAGKNKAALWLQGGPPSCVTSISQAIDARFVKTGDNTSLEFSVPDSLRHQLGLDIAVTNVTSTIKRITKTKRVKGKKRKVGYFESIGCRDRKRDITVTFTDESGTATPARKALSNC